MRNMLDSILKFFEIGYPIAFLPLLTYLKYAPLPRPLNLSCTFSPGTPFTTGPAFVKIKTRINKEVKHHETETAAAVQSGTHST